jgi:hypothetical protein
MSKTEPGTKHQSQLSTQNVHILAVSVWEYDCAELGNLRGPQKDLEMVRKMFLDSEHLGLYGHDQITSLENPTVEVLRSTLVKYAHDRSSTGDILIFYFSGHGSVLPNNEFGFCLKDTVVLPDNGGCIPLSVLSFGDIIRTLATANVHPVFIVDACFSGRIAPNTPSRLVESMHDDVHRVSARSYAILCACHSESAALDSPEGGRFTKALYDVAQKGLTDKTLSREPNLQLQHLSRPIAEKLERDGHPLSKLYVGPDLPEFPLLRNTKYKPRQESLTTDHKGILELLWNKGKPRAVPLSQFSEEINQGAYCNHSKLSETPWNLVEDADNARSRRLTKDGILFVQGKHKVPLKIELNSKNEWHPAPGARLVAFTDIKSPTTVKAKRR